MKTHKAIIKNIMRVVGTSVIHHEKTPENPLGQSGLHTIIDDIQDIFDKHKNDHPSVINKELHKFFLCNEKD